MRCNSPCHPRCFFENMVVKVPENFFRDITKESAPPLGSAAVFSDTFNVATDKIAVLLGEEDMKDCDECGLGHIGLPRIGSSVNLNVKFVCVSYA